MSRSATTICFLGVVLAGLLLPRAAAGAVTGEAVADPAPPVPFLLQHNGGHLEWKEGVANSLTGGIDIRYEAMLIKGERLDFMFGGHPASKQLVVDTAAFSPGPNGPVPDRVLLDNRTSQLPLIGFRGLFMPTGIAITRATAIDPLAPSRLTWRAVFKQPGYFSGELRSASGWQPFAAWAEEIEVVIRADLVGDSLANVRFAEVHVFGREQRDDAELKQQRKLARFDWLLKPLARPEALDAIDITGSDTWKKTVQGGLQTMKLTIEFDDQGSFTVYKPGGATLEYGSPPVNLRKRERSKLVPTK